MKNFGILLIVVGILMLVIGNVSFTRQKKVVDIGPVEINKGVPVNTISTQDKGLCRNSF